MATRHKLEGKFETSLKFQFCPGSVVGSSKTCSLTDFSEEFLCSSVTFAVECNHRLSLHKKDVCIAHQAHSESIGSIVSICIDFLAFTVSLSPRRQEFSECNAGFRRNGSIDRIVISTEDDIFAHESDMLTRIQNCCVAALVLFVISSPKAIGRLEISPCVVKTPSVLIERHAMEFRSVDGIAEEREQIL